MNYMYPFIVNVIFGIVPNCPLLSRKRWDIKSHSSVCLSVSPSVCLSVCLSVCHKNFNLGHNFCNITGRALIFGMCVLCDNPFRWYHIVTLTVTFDLLQGQICCRAGDHNSLNLLVLVYIVLLSISFRRGPFL